MTLNISDGEIREVEKFQSLFREIPAALALLRGPDFIFEMANADYIELIGGRDIIGKPLLEALPEIKDQPFPELLRAVFETGKTWQAREVEALLQRDLKRPENLSTVYLDITYSRILSGDGSPYGIFVFAFDVTEKVKARAIIQLEKLKLEAVFAHSSASLAILQGEDGVYEKANASYLNLFNGRDLIGKPILKALPELQGQKFPDLVTKVFQTGETYTEVEAIAYLRRTNESPLEKRYFDQSYTQISDEGGKRYGVLIQAVDVTERVTNRKKLAESLERYRIAVEAADLGTWDMDLQTGMMDWSPRTGELFGIPTIQKISQMDARQRIHRDDVERVAVAFNKAIDPQGDGNYNIDYRVILGDGSTRWLSVRGKVSFVITPDGPVMDRLAGTVLDITDRILQERQFRLIADTMPQVVWTAKPNGVLDYTNERWLQYSNSNEPEKWLDFVNPEDRASAVEKWAHCLATGERYETEFRLLRNSDQAYRWFLVRAQATRGADGKIERWFGTCTDIEEQKAVLTARSEFMSVASHELKTPLTSLKLQTQSMRRNFAKGKPEAFSNEKISALINNNEKQVDRLVRLVDDMLDFAKIESGKLSMSREPTDIGELCAEIYDRLKEQIESAQCDWQFECHEKVFAEVDRFRIEQVVINLITNALRYGKGKPLKLKVEGIGENVRLSVTDQGIGIAPENQDRIFNRFERAVSANEVSGLGLGLFISKQIVVAHQGRIWVESELKKGSTFIVDLPRVIRPAL